MIFLKLTFLSYSVVEVLGGFSLVEISKLGRGGASFFYTSPEVYYPLPRWVLAHYSNKKNKKKGLFDPTPNGSFVTLEESLGFQNSL